MNKGGMGSTSFGGGMNKGGMGGGMGWVMAAVCLSFVIPVWRCSSQMKITFSNFSNSISRCLLLTTAPHQWEAAWVAWIRVEWEAEWAWIKEGKSSLDLLLISRSESENWLLRDNFRSLRWYPSFLSQLCMYSSSTQQDGRRHEQRRYGRRYGVSNAVFVSRLWYLFEDAQARWKLHSLIFRTLSPVACYSLSSSSMGGGMGMNKGG